MKTAHTASLASLQAGRAAAAMAVVAFHAAGAVSLHIDKLPHVLSQLLWRGYLGVDFFFVLSGFIIYYANAPHSDRPGWASRYAWSRVARIYISLSSGGDRDGPRLPFPRLGQGSRRVEPAVVFDPASGRPARALGGLDAPA